MAVHTMLVIQNICKVFWLVMDIDLSRKKKRQIYGLLHPIPARRLLIRILL